VRKSHTRRLIITRKPLVRALSLGMNQERFRDFTNLFKRIRMEDLETFLVVGAIEPFDKRIFVRSMRWTDMGLDANAEQKTDQRRRKIAPCGSPYTARITIKGELTWAAIRLQKAQHRFQNGLCMEIGTDLGLKEKRSSCIDEIEDLNHMLLLPSRISRNARNAFEVHLDFFKRLRTLDRVTLTKLFVSYTIVATQDLPDRACRVGQCLNPMLKLRITRQIIEDGSRPRSALKMLWRCITNG
jgi:hypothetical protein